MEEIEKLPPDQLKELYRSRYADHIAGHFPELFQLIERRTEEAALRKAAQSGPGVMDRGPNKPPAAPKCRMVGIVDWVDADQKIKSFLDRFYRHDSVNPRHHDGPGRPVGL